MEHPDITKVNMTGYVKQPKHAGNDYFGDEILVGDNAVKDGNTGEIILKENFQRYLEEMYDFKFYEVEEECE